MIGLEKQGKSGAKLAVEVIMPRGLKEKAEWRNDLVVHSLHVSLQWCLALKHSTQGENKRAFLFKHTALSEMFKSFMSFQPRVCL